MNRPLTIVLLVVSMAGAGAFAIESTQPGAVKRPPAKKVAGIDVQKNKVTLKKDYAVGKRVGKRVEIKNAKGGGVIAEVGCICWSDKGSCVLAVRGNIVSCNPEGDCYDCEAEVIFKPEKTANPKSGEQ